MAGIALPASNPPLLRCQLFPNDRIRQEVTSWTELAYLVYLSSAGSAKGPRLRCRSPVSGAEGTSQRLRELVICEAVGGIILNAQPCPSAGGSSLVRFRLGFL